MDYCDQRYRRRPILQVRGRQTAKDHFVSEVRKTLSALLSWVLKQQNCLTLELNVVNKWSGAWLATDRHNGCVRGGQRLIRRRKLVVSAHGTNRVASPSHPPHFPLGSVTRSGVGKVG